MSTDPRRLDANTKRLPSGDQTINEKLSQNCNRIPIRNEREPARSPTDPLVTPPSLVITPTLESVMSVEGFCQFGWFRKLVAVISQRSRTLSLNANCLASPKLSTFTPGPLM